MPRISFTAVVLLFMAAVLFAASPAQAYFLDITILDIDVHIEHLMFAFGALTAAGEFPALIPLTLDVDGSSGFAADARYHLLHAISAAADGFVLTLTREDGGALVTGGPQFSVIGRLIFSDTVSCEVEVCGFHILFNPLFEILGDLSLVNRTRVGPDTFIADLAGARLRMTSGLGGSHIEFPFEATVTFQRQIHSAVPEPTTATLIAASAAGFVALRQRIRIRRAELG